MPAASTDRSSSCAAGRSILSIRANSGGAKMELEAQIIAVEFVLDLLEERAVGIEPRHLVLVLVGHQLEQIARDRIGKPALARSRAASAALTLSTKAR